MYVCRLIAMATRFIMTSKWRSNTELFVTDIFMPLHAQRGVTSATTDSRVVSRLFSYRELVLTTAEVTFYPLGLRLAAEGRIILSFETKR